jgi:ubiquinone/menaquinone biosynthesis C-methylase UbiE
VGLSYGGLVGGEGCRAVGTGVQARYDGLAEWYEQYNAPAVEANRDAVVGLLGPGAGWCLDLGCGSGRYVEAIRHTGRRVVGMDLSADQLRRAKTRAGGGLVQADAAVLPFRDGVFSTVTALWVSTDVDDFSRVLGEAVRVLQPGGLLAYYGVHPCFNGPHMSAIKNFPQSEGLTIT